MRMEEGDATMAIVSARDGCSVTLAYTFFVSPGDESTCDEPGDELLPGRPALCRTLKGGFACKLNAFGAYRCPAHVNVSDYSPHGRLYGWNAKFRGQTLVLDHPAMRTVRTPRPAWLKSYPVVRGFIQPFDKHGQLRAGLTLKRSPRYFCQWLAGQPPLDPLSGLLYCGTGLYCFASRLPLERTERLACPQAPGSKVFFPGRLDFM